MDSPFIFPVLVTTGPFAMIKSTNGFVVPARNSMPAAWIAGSWWRPGRRIGAGELTGEYRKHKRGSQCIPVPVSGEQCVGACRYGGLRGEISDYFALFTSHCALL
jgi:hypothetical protein